VTKLIRITIETNSLRILHGRTWDRVWCRHCEAEVRTIALENVGVISNLERAALAEWLNSGELHRLQATDGHVDLPEFPLGPRTKQQNQLTARQCVCRTEVRRKA